MRPGVGKSPSGRFVGNRLLSHFAVSYIAMAKGRAAPRFLVLKAGTIRSRGRERGCLVRNLSAGGAALEVFTEIEIPGRFVLSVPNDGLELACRVVWRKPTRIGVVFI
jgi:hypothetical protein